MEEALALLTRRGIVKEHGDGSVVTVPSEHALLEFYANTIRQLRDQLKMRSAADD